MFMWYSLYHVDDYPIIPLEHQKKAGLTGESLFNLPFFFKKMSFVVISSQEIVWSPLNCILRRSLVEIRPIFLLEQIFSLFSWEFFRLARPNLSSRFESRYLPAWLVHCDMLMWNDDLVLTRYLSWDFGEGEMPMFYCRFNSTNPLYLYFSYESMIRSSCSYASKCANRFINIDEEIVRYTFYEHYAHMKSHSKVSNDDC